MLMEENIQAMLRNDNNISTKKISCYTWLRARDVATLSIQVFEEITPGPTIGKRKRETEKKMRN